jgi:hypothetical protein
MTYWLSDHARVGNCPMLLVYSRLMGCISRYSTLSGAVGCREVIAGGVFAFGLVDQTFWHVWARCPRMVLSALGQYGAALA